MILKRVLKQWLIHLVIIWLLSNIFNTGSHFYKHSSWGIISDYPPVTLNTILKYIYESNVIKLDYVPLIPFTLLVELSYHCIVKKKNWVVFMLVALAVGTLTAFCFMLLRYHTPGFSIYGKYYLQASLVLAGYALLYYLGREFFRQRLYQIELKLNQSEGELRALKQQLNPHFLFNTLNYLYGTALQENAARTATGIDLMADMMRYTVTGMQQAFVPLSEEIGFIKNYLQLQKLRLPLDNEHTLETNISISDDSYHIAPMVLIPYIENAFKYGISTDNASFIRIRINVENGQLIMQVENSITPGTAKIKGTNSGLAISRKQLELLYAQKHELEVKANDTAYHVQLTLKLK